MMVEVQEKLDQKPFFDYLREIDRLISENDRKMDHLGVFAANMP